VNIKPSCGTLHWSTCGIFTETRMPSSMEHGGQTDLVMPHPKALMTWIRRDLFTSLKCIPDNTTSDAQSFLLDGYAILLYCRSLCFTQTAHCSRSFSIEDIHSTSSTSSAEWVPTIHYLTINHRRKPLDHDEYWRFGDPFTWPHGRRLEQSAAAQ